MDAGDPTDTSQRLLDELHLLRRMLGDEVADRIAPEDIPVLNDIVIDPTSESGPLDIGADSPVEPEHPGEPGSPDVDLALENIDEAAIREGVALDRVAPACDNGAAETDTGDNQPHVEELIDELVDEWLPVLEAALRERLHQLTAAELRSLR